MLEKKGLHGLSMSGGGITWLMSAGLMGAARNLTVISSLKEGEMEYWWRL